MKGKPSWVGQAIGLFFSFSIFIFLKIVILKFNYKASWSNKNIGPSKELSHSPTLPGHFLPPSTLKGNFPKEKIATSIGRAKTKKKKRGRKKLQHQFGKATSQFREANISGNESLERRSNI